MPSRSPMLASTSLISSAIHACLRVIAVTGGAVFVPHDRAGFRWRLLGWVPTKQMARKEGGL